MPQDEYVVKRMTQYVGKRVTQYELYVVKYIPVTIATGDVLCEGSATLCRLLVS